MRSKMFLLLILFSPGILGIPTDDVLQANESSVDIGLSKGIYVNANSRMYRVQPDGTRKLISDTTWTRDGGVRGLAFYKDRLFGIYLNNLAEMTEDNYYYRSDKFAKCKTLTAVNNFLYTFDESRLYKISFPSPNKPIKTAVGHYQVNPSVVAGIAPKYLFLVENGVYHTMDVQTGQGKKLAGKGTPSAAAYCFGHLYIIDINGDIRTLDPKTGEEVNRLTICGRFKGSKGLTCYQDRLWAVGKDSNIYEIDPTKWDEVRPKGTVTYTNTGPMTAYSGNP